MIARNFCLVRWCVVIAGVWSCGTGLRSATALDDVLPGTQKLVLDEPLDVVMVRGISEFAEYEISLSRDRREAHWHRDYSSPEAYEKSIAPNRERLRTYIGAVDVREKDAPIYVNFASNGSRTQQIRMDVWDGVSCEAVSGGGISGKALIFIPDPAYEPEMALGLLPGLAKEQQLPWKLKSEFGIAALIPTLMSRNDELSGSPNVRYTNQPHREFIYRGAFEMGRHVIGYEAQKISTMVDGLLSRQMKDVERRPDKKPFPIIVWGHGEGGLLAMYAAALDPRIEVCIVSGYFQEREGVWKEPIYRNVWRQLTEFGDADIASLIAPRKLIIEASAAPEVDGPPVVRPGRSGGAAPGVIRTPDIESVKREFVRAKAHYQLLGVPNNIKLISYADGPAHLGNQETIGLVNESFNINQPPVITTNEGPPDEEALRQRIAARQKRQFEELRQYTQRLMHVSDKYRDKVWDKADRSSLAKWEETQEAYRTMVYDELIGRIPYELLPPNARTRKIIDEPTHVGYEVVLDVWESRGETRDERGEPVKEAPSASPLSTVFAGGVLLLPKDIKDGEKRPVVVCQHGLEGVPDDTISEDPKHPGFQYYKGFSTALVKRGFIVYAPQNPYRGHDDFRVLQRKSNPLGRSLYSYIIPQHQQTINWLASLPNVDPQRIAFYGLSYGGKTAVRVPPMLAGGKGNAAYCLSIASADFDEWVLKIVTTEDRYSYMFTGEYEIFEWNMGHVANYAELSNLMTPRPFMVERGHDDGVAPDEWVAWEYAKVKRHYDQLGIGDRTELEVFNGPHTINGVGTYEFLHKHLNWPEPE